MAARLTPPLRTLAISLIALWLSACATPSAGIKTYPGAERSPNQLAVLEIPLALEVVYLDRHKASLPLMLGDPYQLQLTPGEHQIHFAYVEDWGAGSQMQYINSGLLAVRFEARAGQRYRLDFDAPGNLREAQMLAASFRAELVDEASGERLDAQAAGRYHSPLNRAFGAGSAVNVPLGVLAATGAESTPDITVSPLATEADSGAVMPEETALQNLQRGWLRASEDQRAAFLNWVVRQ